MIKITWKIFRLISNYDIHAMLFDYASMAFGAEDLVEDPEEQVLSNGNRGGRKCLLIPESVKTKTAPDISQCQIHLGLVGQYCKPDTRNAMSIRENQLNSFFPNLQPPIKVT